MMKKSALLPLLLTGLVAACSSAPTRVYTLQPLAAGSPPRAYGGPPVRVAAVHLPAALDRIEIMTEQREGELRINDLDHWAAPLGKLAQQTLSADLVARLPAGKVAFPSLPAGDTVLELRVDILRVPGGQGQHMVASWQLGPDSRAGTKTVDLPDGASHTDAADAANRFSVLLARLADQIAATLPEPTDP